MKQDSVIVYATSDGIIGVGTALPQAAWPIVEGPEAAVVQAVRACADMEGRVPGLPAECRVATRHTLELFRERMVRWLTDHTHVHGAVQRQTEILLRSTFRRALGEALPADAVRVEERRERWCWMGGAWRSPCGAAGWCGAAAVRGAAGCSPARSPAVGDVRKGGGGGGGGGMSAPAASGREKLTDEEQRDAIEKMTTTMLAIMRVFVAEMEREEIPARQVYAVWLSVWLSAVMSMAHERGCAGEAVAMIKSAMHLLRDVTAQQRPQ